MTGTATGKGLSVLDIDVQRNREWLRRRKLRLEQVRKQSNEIAKALRQKVGNEEKARLNEYDRRSEEKFKNWKAGKLNELEKKFKCALEEFGKGYKLAEEEPDPEEIIENRYKLNLEKAQKRGEIANQEEQRRKKIIEEQKMSLILRKKHTRKKEDLRSALVHSVPKKKQIIDTLKVSDEKDVPSNVKFTTVKRKIISHKDQNVTDFPKKVSMNKGRRKKVAGQKSCMCNRKAKAAEFHPFKGSETIWINLNEIQNSSTGDSGLRALSTKSSLSNEKIQNEKPEGFVEFYDFSSRYYRKAFREFPHLIQRIDPETEMPNANDLAKIEDEKEKVETQKKVEADSATLERGFEALRREKINQEYNNLITRLDDLNRKEKILKAQQRNIPDFFHMNEDRLSERLKTKQRLMDSKFESIYYEVMSQVPRSEPPLSKHFCSKGGGDFSHSHLKYNSPVTSDCEPSGEASPEKKIQMPEETKKKSQLLLDIDRALREGRELRKSISRNRDPTNSNGGEENEREVRGSDSERATPQSPGISCLEGKTTRCQESQTEDLKMVEVGVGGMDLKDFSKTGDDSLPVSTSTSYKSPPSVIKSYRLRQFLDSLGVTEPEDNAFMENKPYVNRNMDGLLHDLLHKKGRNHKSGKKEKNLCPSPTLEYYIEKLLSMSRECIADLSVSSENISTPNLIDVDVREPGETRKKPENPYPRENKTAEDLVRESRLQRADQLAETIENWKRILEKNAGEASELEDVPDCPQQEFMIEDATSEEKCDERVRVIEDPKICSRYEEITKKCSERISELSDMLDKVRKDKEKLLSSTSGGSNLSLNKVGGNSEREFDVDEDDEEREMDDPLEGCVEEPTTSLVEGFLNRYNLSKRTKDTMSTIAMADSQSLEDLEESLESWPDVMDELLKRKILTSPFKWSDGEYSSELSPVSDNHTKPSSIETVIGNFRKEMSKIKPFNLSVSFQPPKPFLKAHSFDERQEEMFGSSKKGARCPTGESEQAFQEESSVESINQALTTLGLNWAKSFLKKNEESRAISSSSNSEGKSSGDEANNYA